MRRGLKQGCPMSSILFLIYIERVARDIYSSGWGYKLYFEEEGTYKTLKIPILLFADDMLILGQELGEMQEMLDICTNRVTELGLEFNEKKSAIVSFNEGGLGGREMKIQGKILPEAEKYKYLGVTFCDNGDHLNVERDIRKCKADRGRRAVKARALWGFNRLIIARDLWKAIFVPAISYGNAVLVFGSEFEKKMEVVQRGVMRYAIGCGFTCANEFVEGEINYSTFLSREFRSKIRYFWGLMENNGKWANEIQKVKQINKIKTKLDRRVEFALRSVGLRGLEWTEESVEREERGLNRKIKGMREVEWQNGMEGKSSLQLYRKYKKEMVGNEIIYDNGEGSRLLANARAGMLNTRVYRSHFMNIVEDCGLCGEGAEDIEHVIKTCKFLGEREGQIEEYLGFGEEIKWDMLSGTKNRLIRWKWETGKIEDTEIFL